MIERGAMIAAYGLAGFTARETADELGLSRQTVYNYWYNQSLLPRQRERGKEGPMLACRYLDWDTEAQTFCKLSQPSCTNECMLFEECSNGESKHRKNRSR
jgi:hypothetical protein